MDDNIVNFLNFNEQIKLNNLEEFLTQTTDKNKIKIIKSNIENYYNFAKLKKAAFENLVYKSVFDFISNLKEDNKVLLEVVEKNVTKLETDFDDELFTTTRDLLEQWNENDNLISTLISILTKKQVDDEKDFIQKLNKLNNEEINTIIRKSYTSILKNY